MTPTPQPQQPLPVPQLPPKQPSAQDVVDSLPDYTRKAVDAWTMRIHDAKAHWLPDFDRMADNRRFVSGKQWQGQEQIDDDRYTVNITLQMVQQKVASLYARNPSVKYQKRDRLWYQIWDGRLETLAVAIMKAQATGMKDMESVATVLDYENGRRIKELLDKVGKTLEILYKAQCDFLEPDFKEQMKSLVRRVLICGVGYVKQSFVREDQQDEPMSSDLNDHNLHRKNTAQHLMRQLSEGEFDESDARVEELKLLITNLHATAPYDQQEITERLVHNFPNAQSIIPDKHCRNLKGFIGSKWVAEEYLLTLSDVNAYFHLDLSNFDISKIYHPEGQEVELHDYKNAMLKWPENPCVCVWEVWDKVTKSSFFVCDGYSGYLQEPQPIVPCTKHFWPWFALTFNDVDCDVDSDVSPFPPSDVQQMKHPQKEWNRTREELRGHRKAKAPRTMVQKGTLTEKDKDNVMDAPSNSVIETEAILPPDGDLRKLIMAWPTEPIDPSVYDTSPLLQDTLMSTGQQETDFGLPQQHSKKGQSATSASIGEQAKISKSSSNVDDLDSLLDALAINGGELLLNEMSLPVVQRIVGPGAVWPMVNKADFVNHIYLTVEAASSGRPNKAMEVANWEKLAPLLMQMGANKFKMVRETVARLDDRMDADDFFPLTPPTNVPPGDPFGKPQGAAGQAANPQPDGGAPSPQGAPQQPAGSAPTPAPPMSPPGQNLPNGSPMPATVER